MWGEEGEQKEGAAPGGSVRVAFTYMYHFLCVYLFSVVLGFFFLHICIISYFCFGGFFTYMYYLLLVCLFFTYIYYFLFCLFLFWGVFTCMCYIFFVYFSFFLTYMYYS